jgi:tricarballylate dehydrogenase
MSKTLPPSTDVIVVGAGNAALCAALASAEQGVSVLVLERAPENEAGGNSRFTAGAFRCVYNGADDLRALMPDLTDDEVAKSDFGTYTEEKFFDDMGRVTEYRTDPDLCEVLVKRAARKQCCGCAKKGYASCPFGVGKPTRSTASSSSGAA